MPIDPNANHKGGVPSDYPLPQPQLLTPSMEGIGAMPLPPDTTKGVIEKDVRAKAYRTLWHNLRTNRLRWGVNDLWQLELQKELVEQPQRCKRVNRWSVGSD